jgi:hypothetical protein
MWREQIEAAVTGFIDRDEPDARRATLGGDDRDAIIQLRRFYCPRLRAARGGQ